MGTPRHRDAQPRTSLHLHHGNPSPSASGRYTPSSQSHQHPIQSRAALQDTTDVHNGAAGSTPSASSHRMRTRSRSITTTTATITRGSPEAPHFVQALQAAQMDNDNTIGRAGRMRTRTSKLPALPPHPPALTSQTLAEHTVANAADAHDAALMWVTETTSAVWKRRQQLEALLLASVHARARDGDGDGVPSMHNSMTGSMISMSSSISSNSSMVASSEWQIQPTDTGEIALARERLRRAVEQKYLAEAEVKRAYEAFVVELKRYAVVSFHPGLPERHADLHLQR